MTEKELQDYIWGKYPKENETCEWKEYSNLKHHIVGKERDDVITYVSAIANNEGGHLLIGVKDKTGNIVGIKNFHTYTPENLPNILKEHCINLSSEGLIVESLKSTDTNKNVWIIHIPKHSPRRPVGAHKKFWQRIGDSLKELTEERYMTIISENIGVDEDWTSVVCKKATIHDLDSLALKVARDNYRKKFPKLENEIRNWDEITFLNKAKLTINGQITRTALLLLGKPESVHFLKPAQPTISWILKNTDNLELDYEHFGIPFLINVDNLFGKIRNLKYRYMKDEGLFPEEIDTYEPYVVREALHNCIAHQDYTMGGRINVVETPDSLIFTNQGIFLPGTVEKVIKQDAPQEILKNPFLAYAMYNLNMIDTIGSGIKRMFLEQKNRLFPLPEYDLSDNRVKVTILGKVLDLKYARLLSRIPELSLEDIMLLDKVQKKKELIREEVKYLKQHKLIEGRKPNYYISSILAQKTEQMPSYIRSRGLKDDYYKKLVLELLEKQGQASRDEIDDLLIDILPEVLDGKKKKNKIKNLLYAMSKIDKTIRNEGSNRKPIWKKNV